MNGHARLRQRLRSLAGEHRRFGYRRLHELLRREGWRAQPQAHCPALPRGTPAIRRPHRKKARTRQDVRPLVSDCCQPAPSRVLLTRVLGGSDDPPADGSWSIDFTEDTLASGRKFRTVNLKDDCTRECPAILVDFSLPGRRFILMLDDVARERGYSDIIVVDNRPSAGGRSDRRSRRGQEAAKGARVHRPQPRELGTSAWRQAVLHRSDLHRRRGQQAAEGQAHAERLDRELQRRGRRPLPGTKASIRAGFAAWTRRAGSSSVGVWAITRSRPTPPCACRRRRPSPPLDRSSDRSRRLGLLSCLGAHRRSRSLLCPRRCYPKRADPTYDWP